MILNINNIEYNITKDLEHYIYNVIGTEKLDVSNGLRFNRSFIDTYIKTCNPSDSDCEQIGKFYFKMLKDGAIGKIII